MERWIAAGTNISDSCLSQLLTNNTAISALNLARNTNQIKHHLDVENKIQKICRRVELMKVFVR